jgi:S-adenosylmethionine:tRNA ribosyltransferase-isomerase
MKIGDFDYNLPNELIAETPAEKRVNSRLLVYRKTDHKIEHKCFYNLSNYLQEGDVLVLNNSKVFPARLLGKKEITAGKVELLLCQQLPDETWKVIGRNLKPNQRINFDGSVLEAAVLEQDGEYYTVRFNFSSSRLMAELDRIGQVPLPPYIVQKRSDKEITINDRDRYQTVYAKEVGSIAAPTAGLHFSHDLMSEIRKKSVDVEEVTLHVGLGTFTPVKVEDVSSHKMHSEHFMANVGALKRIAKAKK